MFDRVFDRILNATLPLNNLLCLEEGLRRSFPSLELCKGILDSPWLLILLIYTTNKKNSSTRQIRLTRVTNSQLPIKAEWWDAPLAFWDFSRSNKHDCSWIALDWINSFSKSWMLDCSLYKVIDVPFGSRVY